MKTKGKNMAKVKVVSVCAWLASCAATAFCAVVEKDWCTATVPDEIIPGQAFEISVTIKPGVDVNGAQLANHLQWAKNKNE